MSVQEEAVPQKPSLLSRYLGLIRFSHTIFALPFALLAAILAWSQGTVFRWQDLLGILLCMVFARTSAMAFNRYVDSEFDAKNPRTAGRHIPSGQLTAKSVLLLTIISSLLFIAATLLFFPNLWPLKLSVPVLLLLLSYSYVKRFSMLAHYWLGAALALSPLATSLALTGTFDSSLLFLAFAIYLWVAGFDIIYACQDAEFDRQAGLHSMPAKLGIPASLRYAAISHFASFFSLLVFSQISGLGLIFQAGVVIVGVLLIYEHSIIKPDDLSRAGIAFFHINALISVGLLAAGIADLLLTR